MFQNAATYNTFLTTYAQACVADEKESIGDFLFPKIEVPTVVGTYNKRDANAGFREYETALARGGDAKEIAINAIKAFWDVKPHGLKASSWKFDTDQEGGESFREDTIRELISTQLVSREAAALRIWRAGVAATPGVGSDWATGNGDPIGEIDELIRSIHARIGRFPNRMVLGMNAWAILKNHPALKSAIMSLNYAATLEVLKGMLINPDMELRVGSLPYQSKKLGNEAGQPKLELVGREIYLFYAQDAPTRDDLSAAKEFTLDGGLEVHTYDRADGLETYDQLLWSSDRQVTCPDAAARIVIA